MEDTMSETAASKSRREPSDIEKLLAKMALGELTGHHYVSLLGLRTFDMPKLLERIRKGLSYRAWERFVRNTTLSNDEALSLVQISPRTLQRRKEEGRLHPDESDRLLRATRVYAKTLALFEGNDQHTRQWLISSQPALNGSTPLDYATTELGAREVEDLIGRLEHGIPS